MDEDGDRQMVVVSIQGWPARQLTECVCELPFAFTFSSVSPPSGCR